MISVTCPYCQTRILVPPTVQGRTGVCFGCGRPLQVPTGLPASPNGTLEFEPGTLIAERYRLADEIGKGGMGVVYRAEDTLVGEAVALKFLNPARLRNQRSMALFIKEAQIARRLRHDNIVAVHDVSTTAEGVPFLTMELVAGPSLRRYLRRRRAKKKMLPVRVAIAITLQILAALQYAHRMVIHRDLKPENVLLLSAERVKVLDFGLALGLEEGTSPPERPAPGRVVGTLAYASPEQRLNRELDHRSDLYSLGLLFREMLTLRTPNEPPFEVSRCRDDVPAEVRKVLEKALAESPEDRFEDAFAFRNALKAAYRTAYRPADDGLAYTSDGGALSLEGMVFIEGGSLALGAPKPDDDPDNGTFVDDFYMDAYPVTVGQYRAFLEASGRPAPPFWRDPAYNGDNQPVVGVTWADAHAYAQWAGKRLPTEAEWEYAARGREGRAYPWGQTEPHPTRANYGNNLSMPSIVTMHDDGATPEGLHDMSGNVWEWTADDFDRDAEQTGSPRKAVRGGSWKSSPAELRATHRAGLFPHETHPTVGFRCIASTRVQQPREPGAGSGV